jgi:eukaryotic-like serine/threonine-protein kinase
LSWDHRRALERCPSDDEVLALVCGAVDEPFRVRLLRHTEECAACALVVAEAGLVLGEAEHLPASRTAQRPSAVFEPGQLVASRYRVERRLGQGGMGEVYAAYDLELGETVALKTIAGALAAEPSAVGRLKLELRLARSVAHPHVGRVFELGRHARADGACQWFFTLQLIAGESLRRYLARRGAPPLAEAMIWAEQLAGGLAAIHAQSVVHRDIKPENVMLSPAEAPSAALWVDFGLARVDLSDTRSPGLLQGTPGYATPELTRGAVASRASDIYAFGVLLHELLYGARPLSAPVAFERPGLPPALCALVKQCLATAPQERPASAEELAQRLGAIRRAGPEAPERGRRWAPWAWLLVVLAAAGSVILLRGRAEAPASVEAPAEAATAPESRDGVPAIASTPPAPSHVTTPLLRPTGRRSASPPSALEPKAPPALEEPTVTDFGGRR